MRLGQAVAGALERLWKMTTRTALRITA